MQNQISDQILAAPPLTVDGFPSKLHRLRPFAFLGSGSFGNVFSVKEPSDGINYALKAIRIPNGVRARVVREVTILQKLLHHDNIVKIKGAWPETIQHSGNYLTFVGIKKVCESSSVTQNSDSDKENEAEERSCPPDSYISHSGRDVMFIKMELCHTSLQEELESDKYLSSDDRLAQGLHIFGQLLSVLEYLDQIGILHNDIRPANILFKEKILKLADFGLSYLLKQNDKVESGELEDMNFQEISRLRCNHYKSPELAWLTFGHQIKVDGTSDVFSVGAVMFRILSSEEDKQNVAHLLDGEVKVEEMFRKIRGQYEEKNWRLLGIVERMVSRFPEDRPKISRKDLELVPYFGLRSCITESPERSDQLTLNSTLTFVSRDEWGAREPRTTLDPLPHPVENVIIIHSSRGEGYCGSDDECAGVMREIQDLHMDQNKWDDGAYQFVIGGNGKVYEGRGWSKAGAHTLHWNKISVGICLMGDFRLHLPPGAQLEATKALIAYGVKIDAISPNYKLYGHRDVRKGFDSPGEYLYQEICSWPHKADPMAFD